MAKPTEAQIEVGCDVARAKLIEMAGALAGYVTDEQIREVVVAVLEATQDVVG